MFEQVFLIIPILFLLAIIILLLMTYNKSKIRTKLLDRYFLEKNLEIILKYFTVSSLKYYLVADPTRDTFSHSIYKYINGNKNGYLLGNIYSHLLVKINMVLCTNFVSHILRTMLDQIIRDNYRHFIEIYFEYKILPRAYEKGYKYRLINELGLIKYNNNKDHTFNYYYLENEFKINTTITFLNAYDELKNKIEKSFNTTIENKDVTFPIYVLLFLEKSTQISKIIIDREFFICNETTLILSNALIFNSEIKRCEFYSFLRLSKNNYARLQELSCKCNKSYVSFFIFKKKSK